jgi:hypothetical protein
MVDSLGSIPTFCFGIWLGVNRMVGSEGERSAAAACPPGGVLEGERQGRGGDGRSDIMSGQSAGGMLRWPLWRW